MKYVPDDTEEIRWKKKCIEDFKSRMCRCGMPKQARMSFCRRCFWRLPDSLRRSLYCQIGQGYEAAYRDACNHLDKKEKTNGA